MLLENASKLRDLAGGFRGDVDRDTRISPKLSEAHF